MRSQRLTVIGGGIGGLTTAICAAEQGVEVTLYERRQRLGGLAWTTAGDFKANWGPHVIYRDGPWWRWLVERGLAKPAHGLPKLPTTRFRYDGRSHRFPPRTTLGALLRLRGADAPVGRSFVDWPMASSGCGRPAGWPTSSGSRRMTTTRGGCRPPVSTNGSGVRPVPAPGWRTSRVAGRHSSLDSPSGPGASGSPCT
jgi:hypothetical protein